MNLLITLSFILALALIFYAISRSLDWLERRTRRKSAVVSASPALIGGASGDGGCSG